jgi:hypothetical protein
MTLDYEASAARLSEWLADMLASDWTPTDGVKQYRDLSAKLEAVAELLNGPEWLFLEHEVDKDPPPATGLDGWPIVTDETNAGRFLGTIMGLRDIAEAAARLADEYPNSRARPELGRAASYFLHIWYEAGKPRPSLYENGEAVGALKSILDAAGYPIDPISVRGILKAALKEFDPLSQPLGFENDRFLVWRQ